MDHKLKQQVEELYDEAIEMAGAAWDTFNGEYDRKKETGKFMRDTYGRKYDTVQINAIIAISLVNTAPDFVKPALLEVYHDEYELAYQELYNRIEDEQN